jgi:hypothetical protein
MIKILNAYGAREWIRQVGGRFNRATAMWELTEEQYANLLVEVEASGKRSNKRDRALWTAWQKVTVEGTRETPDA